jgi:hypothetical protein
VLVGDDTVQGKSGRKISGASHWRNACGSIRQQYRFLWGLDLVILGLVLDFRGKTFRLPVNLRLYRKEADCRRSDRPCRTRNELMREMVQEVLEALPARPVVLVADGHFATRTLLWKVPPNLTAVVPLRRDAAIWRLPGPRDRDAKGRSSMGYR